jgi:hypothetical protein
MAAPQKHHNTSNNSNNTKITTNTSMNKEREEGRLKQQI